jgi:hypothetical protein
MLIFIIKLKLCWKFQPDRRNFWQPGEIVERRTRNRRGKEDIMFNEYFNLGEDTRYR